MAILSLGSEISFINMLILTVVLGAVSNFLGILAVAIAVGEYFFHFYISKKPLAATRN